MPHWTKETKHSWYPYCKWSNSYIIRYTQVKRSATSPREQGSVASAIMTGCQSGIMGGGDLSNRKETSCVHLLNAGFVWTRGPRHQIASRLNARWPTDWAIEDQAKNLNSTARPYDQRAFSPLDPTGSWLSHLALAIYIFVVVDFDALAQASDIQIERRQVVFLCWMQDLNPGSQTPNRQQTECPLTNRLSYRGSS